MAKLLASGEIQYELPFLRTPYNYDRNKAGDESGLLCEDASLAVQDQRDEVDINTIVRRFGLTGELPDDVRAPSYGDFEGVGTYHDAMNAVAAANESFDRLPAEVRAEFGNNPSLFVDFCSDPKNLKRMKELNLLLPEAIKRIDDADAAEKLRVRNLEIAEQDRLEQLRLRKLLNPEGS